MHQVKRAIIMAAGMGKRMRPLTYEVPKPLVRVNGTRMIDSVVHALKYNGINEIYVVVGHLKDQFYDWVQGLHDIHLIENPYYATCNNISSLYVAREHICESLIIDGDQIIANPQVLKPCFELSGYNAVWCDSHTDEWLMDVENGIVKKCSRTGGAHGWQLFSISRWTSEDGLKLKAHLELEFNRGNRDIYWDDVVMFQHFSEYKLGIMEMTKDDVTEIDSLKELITLDNFYQKYNTNDLAKKE